MSALVLSELSLSEQAAVTAAWADALIRRTAALLTRLEPSADTPAQPLVSTPSSVAPPVHGGDADGSNLPPRAEEPAMVEKQITDHPPLLVCAPGHRPRLWQATGEHAVAYYVECSLCQVRTPRFRTPDAAAHAWAARQVAPIAYTVAA